MVRPRSYNLPGHCAYCGQPCPLERLLTDRQMDVLTLYGKGRTTEGIAAVLHIAPKTVETHVLHIRAVLGLEHLYEVIAYGARYIQQRTEEA